MSGAAVVRVLRNPRYAILAFAVSLFVFLFATWLPNLALIQSVLGTPGVTPVSKLAFLASLAGSIATNFTLFSAAVTVAIALLFGIHIALFVYLVRRRVQSVRLGSSAAGGLMGLMSGIFGIGCAACGSVVLTGMLTAAGASGALALMPFKGEEFGIIGITLLLVAISMTAKRITDPQTCRID